MMPSAEGDPWLYRSSLIDLREYSHMGTETKSSIDFHADQNFLHLGFPIETYLQFDERH